MRVFLINLDRDVDRLEHMREQLARAGLPYERVPACRGDDLPEWLRPYFEPAEGADPQALSPGEIGCYASHLSIMRHLVETPEGGPALVLEDDLRIDDGLRPLLAGLERLPSDWDMIRLSNPAKSAAVVRRHVEGVGDIVTYWRVPNNTGAFLITPRGAKQFLTYGGRRLRAIDEDLRRPWEHGLRIYGLLPPPIEANILVSSIGNTRRELPARKRFKAAPRHRLDELAFRIREFGLFGSVVCWIRSHLKR